MNRAIGLAPYPLLALLLGLTAWVYWPGLSGPFLFDDIVHIVSNRHVQIDDLSWHSLRQAWTSSISAFPNSRPLAQLSFGINHALSGLDPRAFKLTNLAIHLLAGLLVFMLALRLARAVDGLQGNARRWLALLTAGTWLLTPLQLTPVLYVVQRMAGLSGLLLLAALLTYVVGRQQLLEPGLKRQGLLLMLLSLPVVGLAFLAKESAVLFPLFVAVLEFTLLRRYRPDGAALRWLIRAIMVLPLLGALALLYALPNLISFNGRPFDMTQRLLTEARVLWDYLRWLLLPEVSQFGLYHDDVQISRSLLQPISTLIAVVAWSLALLWALLRAHRWPLYAFGLLFFVAGHALESTILPLELVFEHRNYLAIFGPLFTLYAWLLGSPHLAKLRPALVLLLPVYLGVHFMVTDTRVEQWRSKAAFVAAQATHHPNSLRANFQMAQYFISSTHPGAKYDQVYEAAKRYLGKALHVRPGHLDSLFGLLVLELQRERRPPETLIDKLESALRSGTADAENLGSFQFTFITDWVRSKSPGLDGKTLLRLLNAALANPGLPRGSRGAVLRNLAAYTESELKDKQGALTYLMRAVELAPDIWPYRRRALRLLIQTGQLDKAEQVLKAARVHRPRMLDDPERAKIAQLIAKLRARRAAKDHAEP